jgi:hypothetical protein
VCGVPAGGEHGAALLHRDDPVGALERLAEGSATGVGAMIQSTKDGAFWRKQVELSLSVRNTYERWWEQNLKAYAPINRDPEQYGSEINTNRTFTLTERKKADLFYQRPDVTLQPTPLMEGPVMGPDGQALTFPPAPGQQSQAVTQQYCLSAHEEIVNEKLGEDGIDATEMMDAVLFDIICTQGVGFTKMGYEAVFTEVEQPDPAWQPDPMLPLEMQKPAMVTVPVPIHEQCFWHHFSGKQAIIPHNFRSTEWDRAPFLGMQFELPLTEGNRQQYQLPPDFTGKKAKDAEKQHYDHGTAQEHLHRRRDFLPERAVSRRRAPPGAPDAVGPGGRHRRAGDRARLPVPDARREGCADPGQPDRVPDSPVQRAQDDRQRVCAVGRDDDPAAGVGAERVPHADGAVPRREHAEVRGERGHPAR